LTISKAKHAFARFRAIADRTTPALICQTDFQVIYNILMDEICAALTDVSNFERASDPELQAYGEAAIAALAQKSDETNGNGDGDELDHD
jgi:hypothetical protein